MNEMMDADVSEQLHQQVRELSAGVSGVVRIEKCRIRKSGLGYLVDIHVEVDGDMSVKSGHRIAHDVGEKLKSSPLRVKDVLVHIEPATTETTKEDSGSSQ